MIAHRRTGPALLLALALACSTDKPSSAPATPRPTPEPAYDVDPTFNALRDTPFDTAALPATIRKPQPLDEDLRPEDRRNNIARQLMILFESNDAGLRADYSLYPTAEDARKEMDQAEVPLYADQVFVSRFKGAGGHTCHNWKTSARDVAAARFGLTKCFARVGNVIVQAGSFLLSREDQGMRENAEVLLPAGLAHLGKVPRRT